MFIVPKSGVKLYK